jgi:hypothetical protein
VIVTAERRVTVAWTFAIVAVTLASSALPLLFLAGLSASASWLVKPWLIVLAVSSVFGVVTSLRRPVLFAPAFLSGIAGAVAIGIKVLLAS